MNGSYSPINYVVIVIYLVFVLFVGLKVADKNPKGKTFFKGNDGTIPWWVSAVSLFATMLSPISFLTLSGRSFMQNWASWLGQLGLFLAVPITIIWFLPVYKKMHLDTAYEYLERRFNKNLRFLGSITFIVFQIGRNAIIMYLPAVALGLIAHVNIDVLILIMGIIALIYATIGGLKSVLWTDFIQGLVLSAGAVFAFFYLIFHVHGGFSEIINYGVSHAKFFNSSQVLSLSIFKQGLPVVVIGAGLSTLSSYVSSQDMVQRYITTDDLGEMKKMTYLNGFLSLGVATLFFFIGTAMFVFYKQNPSLLLSGTAVEDKIFAGFIVKQLPVGLSGLLLAGLFACGQSSLSSGINGIASTWTLDITKSIRNNFSDKQATKYGKYLSFGVGVVSIALAIVFAHSHVESAFAWFNGFMGLILGLVGGLFALGIFTKKANSKGALIGFFFGLVISILVKYFTTITFWAYSIVSILAVMVIGYIASLFFKEENTNVKEDLNDITVYGLKDK